MNQNGKSKSKAEPGRKGRRAYLDEYEMDDSGRYVYTGTAYVWKSPRKASMRTLWLLAAASFGAQLAAGCVSNTGMNGRAWVLLPYAAAIAASVSLVWGNYTLADGGEKIPGHIYRKSVEALPIRALLTAVFSSIAIVGELVNLLWQSQFTGSISGALLYALAEAGSLVFAVLLRIAVRRLEWEEKDAEP
ncbi:MAG: hypothetical protein LUI13_05090 [Lachnospiraceae bacterium]|nr:hypothetical protein [Lachnospiraceae bacterium]